MSFTNWVTNRSKREEAGHLQGMQNCKGVLNMHLLITLVHEVQVSSQKTKCMIILNMMMVPRNLRYILLELHLFQQLEDGLQEADEK